MSGSALKCLNPFNYNPLRQVLTETVDFDAFRSGHCPVKLFLSVTNVRTGKIKVFENDAIGPDAVLGSACLPPMFQAVEIDGEHYWDGGYMGNPAIFPLIYRCDSRDGVIVHINPLERAKLPTTAAEIMNRINEISFNSSLMRDARDSLRHQADRRRQDTAIHIRAACRSEQHRLASRTRLVLGAVETWIALWLIGVPVSPIEAVILESLTQALRAAAFPVPSALGVQEGGFTVLGALFGITPEAALALSCVKRVPDLAIGLPGLLAWYWLQLRRLLPVPATVRPLSPHPSRAELRVDGLRAAAAPLLGKRMIGMDEGYVIGDWTAAAPALTSSAVCPVNSWNEWDPLEEVIVGRLDGAVVPPYHVSVTYNRPHSTSWLHRLVAGRRYPKWMVRRAQTELDGFVRLLEAERVRVRRPEPIDQRRRVRTRLWSSRGFYLACPRDIHLVVGDEIIETPTCWRSRYFEGEAYRKLFKEYFAGGARWTAAPRPQLPDELFDASYRVPEPEETIRYIVNEFEPVFDAADVARCGRDLFVTPSNVTNQAGIRWLRRHLSDRGLRLNELESQCSRPMHIDTTFVPLAPGKVLVNPDFIDVDRLPPIVKRWDVLIAPRPDPVDDLMAKFSMCSPWTSINVLMLDHRRVVVEASQPMLHRALKDWGFEPLPLPFVAYGPFGGAFHCATLDTRRRGALEDYF